MHFKEHLLSTRGKGTDVQLQAKILFLAFLTPVQPWVSHIVSFSFLNKDDSWSFCKGGTCESTSKTIQT